MEEVKQITLNPIGRVHTDFHNIDQVPVKGGEAFIEIFPDYLPALLRIEENSHLWILSWFHKAERDVLQVVPKKVNENLPEYGVFSIRAFKRPNPVALSLVHLKKVAENGLFVKGLDAINGTPIVDIKPYYEQDIVFSPRTPYIQPAKMEMHRQILLSEALAHHREECPALYMGVRMALIADKIMGQLTNDNLSVFVRGSLCLADVLQGLTHARLANPPRFTFQESSGEGQSIWGNAERKLILKARFELDKDAFLTVEDEKLFELELLPGGAEQ